MPRRNVELVGARPRTSPARSVGPGGRYRLARLLATDPLGTLWNAQDADTDSPVTIRMLDPVLATDLAVVLRFVRLVGRSEGVRHRNLVQILAHHSGRSAVDELVVMEPLDGTTLAGALAGGGKIDRGEALAILAGIARGLATAHREGLSHGHLTTDHVVVTSDAEVKVIDLGIAGIETGSVERESDAGAADPAQDVRALAILAARLLGGELVLLTGTPPAPSGARWTGLPDDLARLLQRALGPPSSRPGASELADVLAVAPGLRRPDGIAASAARQAASPANLRHAEEPVDAAPVAPRMVPGLEAQESQAAAPEATAPEPAPRVVQVATERRHGLLLTAGVCALLLVGFVAWTAFRDGGAGGLMQRDLSVQIRGTTVPDVLGLPFERAQERLQRADLVVGRVLETSGEEGIVIATDPTPGEAVRTGSSVTVLRGSGVEG